MIPSELKKRIEDLIPSLEGWCTPDKALYISDIIYNNPSINNIVEIGIFGGRFTLAMALVCKVLGRGRVIGIDPYSNKDAVENFENDPPNADWWGKINMLDILNGVLRKSNELELNPFVTIIRERSDTAIQHINSIDLIHIDGNHSSEQSLKDVNMYLPKVVSGGYICFDDSNWNTTTGAVARLKEIGKLVYEADSWILVQKN